MAQQDLFRMAAEQVSAELEAKRAVEDEAKLDQQNDLSLMPDFLDNIQQSIGAGMAKAAFETKDFLFGEPAEADKSQIRKDIEATDRALDNKSIGYGLTSGISQFATGLIGAGKLMAPIKAAGKVKNAGKVGRAVYESVRGALAGSIVIDPHEERLSDLIESFPALQNPVSAYLAADPADSDAEGRLKNALEGIGLDIAMAGVFALSLKALRYAKAGNAEAAQATFKEIEKARKGNAEAFGLPGTPARFDPEEGFDAAGHQRNVQEFGLPGQPAAAKGGDPSAVEVRGAAQTAGDPEVPPAAGNAPTAVPEAATGQIEQVASSKGRVKPLVKPEPEFDLPALSKSVSDDLEAISEHGSKQAAREAGHVFTPDAQLPWQKLNSPMERQAFINATVEQAQKVFDAKKGGDVMSDARVRRVVSQMAEVYNEDPAAIAGMLSQAGDQAKGMVARMETSFLVGQKMFQDAYDVQFRIENGLLDEWGGDAAAAQAELKKRLVAALDVTASGNSILANAGRSLRRARSQFRIRPEDINEIATMDGDTLSRLVSGTKGDPKLLVKIANKKTLDRVLEGANSLLANNLLWLYPTHVVNVTTNLMMLVGRPTEKLIGGTVLRNSAARKQALKEYTYLTSSLADAWHTAVEAFLAGDSSLKPHGDEFANVSGSLNRDVRSGWQPANSVWNILGNGLKAGAITIGLPTRALGGVDEFVKQLRYRAVVQAQAAIEATEQGLTGVTYRRYVEDKLAGAFDAEGRGINPAALREAQTVTFQNELNYDTWFGVQSMGAIARNARSNQPVIGLLLPFIKTPVNVLRYAVKLTPGLSLLQKEYTMALAGKSGAEAQAHAVGQFALGSLFLGTAAALALEGRITGGGPEDPNQRKEMMAQGWKPYSVVAYNEDGSKTYFPIGRFDPAGLVFSIVADLVDMKVLHPDRGDKADKGIGAVAIALAKNFGEKTFLLNLNQALRALTEPERNMAKFAGGLVGNMVPGSSALRGYVNTDPYLREARSFVDNIMKDLPGYSSTLPPQRDVFGEPVWRRRGITTSQDEDLVEEENMRIIEETGKGIGRPSPSPAPGVDLRDITLEDGRNAYDKYQEYASKRGNTALKDALARRIRSDGYQQLVDGPADVRGTKLNALAGIVSDFRRAAMARLRAESPLLRATLRKQSMDVRAGILKQRADQRDGKSPAQSLIETLQQSR